MSGLLVSRRGTLNPSGGAAVGSYADEVAADAPVHWWRMEETSGSTVSNSGSGSATGTVVGANLNVAGLGGTASGVSFDGTDDRIDVGTLSDISFGGSAAFTIELLVQTSDSENLAMMFGSTDTSTDRILQSYFADVSAVRRIRADLRTNEGTTIATAGPTAAALADGNPHHLAFVRASGATSFSVYLDGVDSTNAVIENDVTSAITLSRPMLIGARNANGTAGLFHGGIQDEFAIYNKVLTPARILVHAQAAGVA